MNLYQLLSTRRSIRRYKEDAVPKELLHQILQGALWAPSSHNRQPWRFVVLESFDEKAKLARAMGEALRTDRTRDGDDPALIDKDVSNSYIRLTSTPVLIVVFATTIEMDSYPDQKRSNAEYLMAVQSTSMAVQNILLSAHSKGLGSCFMCAPLFCQNVVVEILGVPKDWRAQGVLTLGFPLDKGRDRKKKALEDVLWQKK